MRQLISNKNKKKAAKRLGNIYKQTEAVRFSFRLPFWGASGLNQT